VTTAGTARARQPEPELGARVIRVESEVPHPADRPQSWSDCDPDLRAYVLDSLTATGLRTVGVYVHGSLAMRCFHRAKSDVDLLMDTAGTPPPC